MKVSLNFESINKKINGGQNYNKVSEGQYWSVKDAHLDDLVAHIQLGHAWMPAAIDVEVDGKTKKRLAANCNFAELLAMDVDNSAALLDAEGKPVKGNDGQGIKVYQHDLTIAEAIAHPFLKAHACLIVPSANNTADWNKFRILFRIRDPLTSGALIKSAYEYLMELFPCADKACKDSSRFFYGALNAEIALINHDAYLPDDFLLNICETNTKKLEEQQKRFDERKTWIFSNNAADDTDERVITAFNCLPQRVAGTGTYHAWRDSIWGLVSHFGDSKAVVIATNHSPDQVRAIEKTAAAYDANRGIGVGSLFYHAETYGYKHPKRPAKNSNRGLSISEIAIASGKNIKGKQYVVQLSQICDRPTKDLLQGISENVTMSLLLAGYRELRGWENVLPAIAPETICSSRADTIINKLAYRYHFDFEVVQRALVTIKDAAKKYKPSLYESEGNDGLMARIRLCRVRFFEIPDQDGSPETMKKIQAIKVKEQAEAGYLRDRLAASLNSVLIFDLSIQNWYAYAGGIWERIDVSVVEKKLRHLERDLSANDDSLKGFDPPTKLLKEKLASLKSARLQRKMDDAPKNLLPLRDGVLDRKTMQLLPHDRQYRFTWQLALNWADRGRGCAPILDYINSFVGGDKQQAKLMLAWLNACVNGRSDLQRFMELVGIEGSGKSTFANLAIALVGTKNTAISNLETLEKNNFETASFKNKKLIVFNDVSEIAGNSGKLKALTGEDMIRFEEKGKQQCEGFRYGGLVMIVGEKPVKFSDNSGGLARRRVSVAFDKKIEAMHQRDLIKINDENITGEFAPYLAGLLETVLSISDEDIRNLVKLTEAFVPSLAATKNKILIQTNPLAAWFDARCLLNPDSEVAIGIGKPLGISRGDSHSRISHTEFADSDKKLYPNYLEYCHVSGIKPISVSRFSDDVLNLLNSQLNIKNITKVHRRTATVLTGLALRCDDTVSPKPLSPQRCDDYVMTCDDYVMAKSLASDDRDDCDDFLQVPHDVEKNKDTIPAPIIQAQENKFNIYRTSPEKSSQSSQSSPVMVSAITEPSQAITQSSQIEVKQPSILSAQSTVTPLKSKSKQFIAGENVVILADPHKGKKGVIIKYFDRGMYEVDLSGTIHTIAKENMQSICF